MHAVVQSILCTRLLLRPRGAYNQISNATIISTRTGRVDPNQSTNIDLVVQTQSQSQLGSIDYIAMDELELTAAASLPSV